MANVKICDGNGERADNLTQIGPLGREYSDDIIDHVREYIAAVDDLHDKLRAQWQKDYEKLSKKFALKNGKLPYER